MIEGRTCMRALSVFLAIFLWFIIITSASVAYAPTEAITTTGAMAMKTEADMKAFLEFRRLKQFDAAWKLLNLNGLFLKKGTEVILTGSGCDGECVRFRIKGLKKEYWALPFAGRQKVFEYKKSK
jgi:hypothetical protein